MSSGQFHPNTYNDSKPPPGYIPGLGRGAMGFTTRSDIGPARAAAAASAKGEGGVGVAGAGSTPQTRKEGDYSETMFDKFSGYGGEKLFEDTPYDKDDMEADNIYEAVDERMDSRRKRQREENLKKVMEKYRLERPRIVDQFVDLKNGLAKMSRDDWAQLPDGANFTQRAKLKRKQAQQRELNMAMPDSVITGRRLGSEITTVLDARAQPGIATPFAKASGTASTVPGQGGEYAGLAEARGAVLSSKLDKMGDSVSGQTVVDPRGYLTSLNSLHVDSEAEVGDYKKAELLLRKLIDTNPNHAPGWIALARLQKTARKLALARKVIRQGCEACPKNEDVWLEAAKLATPENAAVILANAVRHIPLSVKVWMYAAELETDTDSKRAVLRRALGFVPNSVRLWKAAIGLEDDEEDAKIMLARAVECVPHNVDMWLALARLETYENAQRVLNQAHTALPNEPIIWVAAAKLEEAHGHEDMVDKVIAKAVSELTLSAAGAGGGVKGSVDRDAWIKQAELCERSDAPLTCSSIIRHCLGLGVEEEDRRRTWLADATALEAKGSIQCARAVYAHTLGVFPKKESIWMAAATLEKSKGSPEALEALLREAVGHCPHAEVLWMMGAKEKWKQGDVDTARAILQEAFRANPDSEPIWLAAAKLESENGELEGARFVLERARESAPSARVWMKSALLERECGNRDKEAEMLEQATAAFPNDEKLWIMAAQCAVAREKSGKAALGYYQKGLRACPQSVIMWRLFSELHEQCGNAQKARNVLEVARMKNPASPYLWLAAIGFARREGQEKRAATLLAKALQECPTSGALRAEDIRSAGRAATKSKVEAALQKCGDDPEVVTEVAKFFVELGKYKPARKWFNRAVTLDPDFGDAWAEYYAFELAKGKEEQQSAVMSKCVKADPRHGQKWNAVAKQTAHMRKSVEDKLRLVVASLLAGRSAAGTTRKTKGTKRKRDERDA